MIKPRCIAIFLAAIFLISCAHSYEVQQGGGGLPKIQLANDESIFVSLPEDGRYGKKVYPGSGRMVNQAVVRALFPNSRNVHSGKHLTDQEGNLEEARKAGASYLVYGEILHWEDRLTIISMQRDEISVRLLLLDVPTGKILDSSLITGKSLWFTIGHGEDLLRLPMEQYVSQFFSKDFSGEKDKEIEKEGPHSLLSHWVDLLAQQLSTSIQIHKISRVAVLPISHVSKGMNKPLGHYLTDRLTNALYRTDSAKVVERFRLEMVTGELALTKTGRFNENSAKHIGSLLGVDAVIIGTYTELGTKTFEVNSRIVSVETGEILGVGSVQIPRNVLSWPLA